MNISTNCRYTKDHEWIRLEGTQAFAGVSDYAQGQLGDVVFIEVNSEGETLKKGEVFGTIEAVKTVSDVYMPISGKVMEVNPALESSPDLVNKDPYGDGWMIRIEVSDPSEANGLMDAAAYEAYLGTL